MNRKYSIFVQAPNHYCHPRFWAEINGDKCVFERKTGVCGSTGPITLIVGDSGLWEAVRNSEREGGVYEILRLSLYWAKIGIILTWSGKLLIIDYRSRKALLDGVSQASVMLSNYPTWASHYISTKNSLSSKAGSENTQRPYLVQAAICFLNTYCIVFIGRNVGSSGRVIGWKSSNNPFVNSR